MMRTTARVLVTLGATLSLVVVGSGVAFADATAYVEGGGGRAIYDASSDQLGARDTLCEAGGDRNVLAEFRWSRPGHATFWQWGVVDYHCENDHAAWIDLTSSMPSDADGVYIRACKLDAGEPFDCGDPDFSRP